MGDGTGAGPMIEAEGLVKHYGKTRALAGVSFAVPAGTVLGLLAPNGAGKPVTGLRHCLALGRGRWIGR